MECFGNFKLKCAFQITINYFLPNLRNEMCLSVFMQGQNCKNFGSNNGTLNKRILTTKQSLLACHPLRNFP